ncbi:MAG: hypothetical protein AB1817_15895, partial [Chloroflexota bacterium]
MNESESQYSFAQTITEAEQAPRGNFFILRGLILLAFVLLALQLGNIQVVNGEYYQRAADQNRFRLTSTDALRGIIYDRSGKILVRNIPSFNVSITPADFPLDQRERVFQQLAALLQTPIDTVIENVTTDAVGSLPSEIARVVIPPKRKPGLRELVTTGQRDPFTPVLIKSNVPREIAFYLEEHRLDFPGVVVGLEPVREYVEGALLSHILGYTGHIPREQFDAYRALGYAPTDQVGLMGLESTFESDLRGTKGRRYIEVDVTGREVALLGSEPPTPGHNIVLTLDTEFQKNVQTILQKALKSARAKQGVAIALDPRTGAILAMVTLPSF